jgi:hypothetical protein
VDELTCGPAIYHATEKTTPVDADKFPLVDSTTSTHLVRWFSWANLKAKLKTYFDGLYLSLAGKSIQHGQATTGGEGTAFGYYYADVDVTFPAAFSSAPRIILTSIEIWGAVTAINGVSATQVKIRALSHVSGFIGSRKVDWVAIGTLA